MAPSPYAQLQLTGSLQPHPLTREEASDLTSEAAVTLLCREKIGVCPVAQALFGLRSVHGGYWLAPDQCLGDASLLKVGKAFKSYSLIAIAFRKGFFGDTVTRVLGEVDDEN